jgi:hypothetical protein
MIFNYIVNNQKFNCKVDLRNNFDLDKILEDLSILLDKPIIALLISIQTIHIQNVTLNNYINVSTYWLLWNIN